MQNAKENLRNQIRKYLYSLSSKVVIKKSEKVKIQFELLLKHISETSVSSIHKNLSIGCYSPIKNEVDCRIIVENQKSNKLCFPGMGSEGMIFQSCSFNELEESKKFGVKIMTPPPTAFLMIPDLIIVPGLCFSDDKKRLGRGKGFYDRYLEDYKGFKVGVCFDEQLVEEIPTDSHDIEMDYVVSSSEVFGMESNSSF